MPVLARADREAFQACAINAQDAAQIAECRKIHLTADEQQDVVQNTPSTGKSITTLVDIAGGVVSTVLTPIFVLLMGVAAAFLAFSGLILDYIINMTVVNLANNIKDIGAINTTWKVIRDIGNMSFIFILLYEGIRMVLGLGGAGVKKVVSGIVIAAILVNFSLLFTKVVIDASNIVTLGFYKSIVSSGTTQIAGYEVNFGLTGAFMKALRLSSLYTPSNLATVVLSGDKGITIFLGNTLFMLIAAFVFLAIAFMFIIRYLSFIILLIMSPIFFISLAVPGLDDLKKKYSQTLMGQALFAPVYMLLTWITLTVAGDSGFLKSTITSSFGDALAQPNGSSISLIVDYILIIGLLIYSIILSKGVATKGGFAGSKLIDKGTGYIGGAIFGGAARAGTQTVGRLGRAVADSDMLRERVEKGGVTGKLAKWTLQGAKNTADASFDFRNTSVLGDQLSKAGAGKGIKGGYDSYLKEKKKEDKELLELIKPSDRAVAQAEETLKSDAFKAEEQQRKDDYFAGPEYAQVVQTEKAKRKKALKDAEDAKKKSENDLAEAQKELTKITSAIESSSEYINLQTKLAAATSAEGRKIIQDQIDEKRKPIDLVVAQIETIDRVIKEKESVRNKADEALNTGFKNWLDAQYNSWISEPQQKLIAIKGGQDEKKYSKKENSDLAGQVKTREVLPQSDIRAKAIAERLGNKKSFWMPWMYATGDVPEFSKDRARAAKKGLKKKKSVEEELKTLAKEEADNAIDDAAPAATPPTPPPTPKP